MSESDVKQERISIQPGPGGINRTAKLQFFLSVYAKICVIRVISGKIWKPFKAFLFRCSNRNNHISGLLSGHYIFVSLGDFI